MANVLPNASLAALNALRFDVRCQTLIKANTRPDLLHACLLARQQACALLPIGGGSNLILRERIDGIVVHIATQGVRLVEEDAETVTLDVEAGENWHRFVAYCVAEGWNGLENLALIPGTVGAAPMQNIGAYGVEVADRIEAVEVLDRQRLASCWISAAECGFGYRQSHFKSRWRDQYLIMAVRFKLLKHPQLQVAYQGLQAALDGSKPTPEAVFNAVVALRQQKLPDPATLPNVGSFFKNPVVSEAKAAALRKQYPGLVAYADPQGVKLAAGWLIDHAGWKGYRRGSVGVHAQQALVLVHFGGGDATALLRLANDIRDDIQQRFEVELEIEPVICP